MNKDEGGRPATKEDVEKLSTKLEATREELLDRMATKEELRAVEERLTARMATKKELDKVQNSLNSLGFQVAQNSERLDQMVTKDEFSSSQDRVFTALDRILGIVKRLDEERIFEVEWLKRHDRELKEHALVLEEHTVEIEGLKILLPTGTDASS